MSAPKRVLPAVAGCAALLLAAGCGAGARDPAVTAPSRQASAPTSGPATPVPAPSSSTSAPAPAPGSPTPKPSDARADPRWRFFSADKAWHTSPWFAGAHRVMIGFGCTVAPWYAHDPRCPGRQGFHHGIDVAMPCGTPLFAGLAGTVVDPSSAGSPGAAYGPSAFRIRNRRARVDVLIGHVRRVFVRPGDRVRRGERIALASDAGAPDGCHLHFEVRPEGSGYTRAVDPARYLRLSR
ncbi:MAG: M23 family metallopeptidase [Nocardioidaceae bacterium]